MAKLYIPTREEIQSLKVGDTVLNCFGDEKPVTEIVERKEDVNGKLFAYFYQEFGNGSMSHSMKEDQLVRTVAVSGHFTSWELDDIEKEMLRAGERERLV